MPSKTIATAVVQLCAAPLPHPLCIIAFGRRGALHCIARVTFFRAVTHRLQFASLPGPWLRAQRHLVKHQRLMKFNGSTRTVTPSTTVRIIHSVLYLHRAIQLKIHSSFILALRASFTCCLTAASSLFSSSHWRHIQREVERWTSQCVPTQQW